MKKPGFNWIVTGASTALNAGLWILVFLTFPKDAPAAVLHYSVGIGIDFVGQGRQIMALPIVGTVLLIMNTALAFFLSTSSRRAAAALWTTAPVIQLILIAAYLSIWSMNS